MKEYSINVRDFCGFISINDKHRIQIGEPGYPVAAAERGQLVSVRKDKLLTVGDNDFTKFSPYHSWRNPVEHVMTILNLGLQCVGLAHRKRASRV